MFNVKLLLNVSDRTRIHCKKSCLSLSKLEMLPLTNSRQQLIKILVVVIVCFSWFLVSKQLHGLWNASSLPAPLGTLSDRFYRLAVLPGSANADGAKKSIHAHLKAVLQGCGDICRVDMDRKPSLYFFCVSGMLGAVSSLHQSIETRNQKD